ncbi:tetratricopeptide repeat protein [Halosquirtibacter xylanolyticus]|uniref:tetratricopeptide repeat protein n=1 Tax=Halosquirtibacter xylanolyticus TaxID=3374599 RepID=UPI003749C1C3
MIWTSTFRTLLCVTGIVLSCILTSQGNTKSDTFTTSKHTISTYDFSSNLPLITNSYALADSTSKKKGKPIEETKYDFPSKAQQAVGKVTSNVENAVKVITTKADKVIKDIGPVVDTTANKVAKEANRIFDDISTATSKTIDDLSSNKVDEVKETKSTPKETYTTEHKFDRAMTLLYEEMEIKEGYGILQSEARKGNIKSQLFLTLYPNATKFSSLSPSLDQIYEGAVEGNVEYQYLLGKSYLGTDYIIHIEKAVVWLQKASNSKQIAATRLLAHLTYYGIGVVKNEGKAFQMLTTAAKQKDTIALRMIADAYLYGKFKKKIDPKKAIPFLLPLAQSGQVTAQKELGKIYYRGKRSKSILWYHKAANQGDLEANKLLADLYYEGTGVVKDYKNAKTLYIKAADLGDVEALTRLGDIYYYGKGVKRNYSTACGWYKKAMMKGAKAPAEKLSTCYDKGWGVKRDPIYRDFILGKASKHYKLTSEEKRALGDKVRLYNFGAKLDVDFSGETHHRIGREFDKKGDFKKAFYWNKEGAKLGYVTSHQILGDYYIKGMGTKVNRDSALHHYIVAASLRNKKANKHLKTYNYKRANPTIVKKDIEALTTIAYQGNKRIAAFLSTCYDHDDMGVNYDQEKSAFWKKVAESQSKVIALDQWSEKQWKDLDFITNQAYAMNFKAQSVLGYWYLTGIDQKENLSNGMMWLQSAVRGGDKDAAFLLASVYYAGYKTILPNKKAYATWIAKAYESKNAAMKLAAIQLKLSQNLSATYLAQVITDLKALGKVDLNGTALTWTQWITKHPSEITQAINSNHRLRSIELLARIYFYGPYPIHDPNKSMIYYQQAVNQQSVIAKINLGYGYQYSLIPQGRSTKALFYWRALGRENSALAKPYLYRAYDQGIGTKKNKRFAKRYQPSESQVL